MHPKKSGGHGAGPVLSFEKLAMICCRVEHGLWNRS